MRGWLMPTRFAAWLTLSSSTSATSDGSNGRRVSFIRMTNTEHTRHVVAGSTYGFLP
jgi:hypothetical protein